jgi:hypothetical protein
MQSTDEFLAAGFARFIVDSVLGSVDVEYVRMFPMELGQRTDPESVRH